MVIASSVFVGLLFYVTSADSGALVMGNLSSDLRSVQDDAAPWLRIVWASTTGLLTIAVLAVGGIYALQYATVIFGLPFAFVVRAGDGRTAQGAAGGGADAPTPAGTACRTCSPGETRPGPTSEEPGEARLARAVNFVSVEAATSYLQEVVRPALTEVADELRERGLPAEVADGVATDDDEDAGLPWVELRSVADDDRFVYRVQVSESPVPTYGGRMIGNRDEYARLEVHTVGGGQDYDVMGYSAEQVIHDCLDQYERHLEFLRMA